MRSVRFTVNLMLLLAVLSSAVLASGFENFAVGNQARAMGGAFRAIADDWTAAYYNPAGYGRMLDNQAGGAVAFFQLRDQINPDYRWGGVFETGVFNSRVNYNEHEILEYPFGRFRASHADRGRDGIGFSIYQPFDYNVGWKLMEPLYAYNPFADVSGEQYRNNLDVVAFQLTAA